MALEKLLHSSVGYRTALESRHESPTLDPVRLVDELRQQLYPWFLDSATRDGDQARFSFAGSDPYLVARAYSSRVEIECRRAVRPDWEPGRCVLEGPPLAVLRALLPQLAREDQAERSPFVGGAVGYLGYEFGSQIEPVESRTDDDLGLPDFVFLLVDHVVVFDHLERTVRSHALGFGANPAQARLRARQRLAEILPSESAVGAAEPSRSNGGGTPLPEGSRQSTLETRFPAQLVVPFDEAAYAKSVTRILEEIAAGNVYQVDLTHRMDIAYRGDPFTLYRSLRGINPAPFAAFLELPEVSILSSSPERFLRVDAAGCVESRPIKGTRRRGLTAAQDDELARELRDSEKDRAENLMIVDLVRNDLGKVCRAGSVAVPELMRLETLASVFQLVSRVNGMLREDCDALDAVAAAFPPGSMTGAPKIAAMEWIDRLETVRRGVYSGAMGYFDARGGADLSVVIRTLLVCGGRAYLQVGGGVVADSDPADEYRETLDKARALLAALEATA